MYKKTFLLLMIFEGKVLGHNCYLHKSSMLNGSYQNHLFVAERFNTVKFIQIFFQIIVTSQQYPSFLEHSLRIFMDILQKGKPHFIAEHSVHVST